MQVHVADLRSGDIVSRDVFNAYGLFVLPAGTQLSDSDIAKLFQHHIEYVDIEPRRDHVPSALRLKPMFEQAVSGSESLFREALEEGIVRQEQFDEVFRPLTDKLPEERDVVSVLLLLNTEAEYTFTHSVRVGILSYYIAKWLNLNEEEALTISKAGFLCDIGKCRIDPALLNKPEPLTEEEFRLVRKYPIYGYEIIKRSFGNELMAKAVLQHLERLDGSGHPYGIKGDDIHFFARIVAVADVCSAMISTRTYRERRDLLNVLKVLFRLSFNELDPLVVQTFIRRLLPFFIGKTAVLSNGESGIIVMTNPTDFFRPLLRCGDTFIDVSQHRDLEVVDIVM
ncbi:MAG: HD family phosphohydrolase [Thermobacillus sp. ZCTH02-B1]|uniref:HD-GYP domain-containing protein n=1 Tax=Thermobacillus sp. ZCTH02-B1 TaxID=1858795 RepID=UPI000B55C2F6|nr:HD-GYP domain-containing protein [Thermobacillus sp. ZCTH02-B1]OUM96154.1 MAG: HD family phosphohydrolase [Thermobacillus sp. ZCTH02-B1]